MQETQGEKKEANKSGDEESLVDFPVEMAGFSYDSHFAHATRDGHGENRLEIAGALAGFHGEEGTTQTTDTKRYSNSDNRMIPLVFWIGR